MASAAVTPTMRTAGWNIELLLKPHDVPFAGVFQPSHSVFMTFRDILDDLRLGFEIPGEQPNVWDDIAFSLADMLNVSEDECPAPTFVHGEALGQLVPPLPELDTSVLENRPALQYHLFRHSECSIPTDQAVASHFKAGCAQMLPEPIRRHDPRYLPPKKASSNPLHTAYPLRKTARTRTGSTSPKKRSSSGSASPHKNGENDDEDPLSMVAPLEYNIPEATARATMVSFRQNCLTLAGRCAVTGMGRSWCLYPTFGPALQACHIVPQMQYHTYPDPQVDGVDGDATEVVSARKLQAAWKRTWSPKNGILLFSHLHELFDTRLFSIHPQTLRIRVFMPYDILLQYHGRIANIPRNTDRAALKHHYEMCCIENIAAEVPFEEAGVWESVASTSSVLTPLDIRTRLPRVVDSRGEDQPSQTDANEQREGDPVKRARQAPADGLDMDGHVLDVGDSRKRKRVHELWGAAEITVKDGYITPDNCHGFLADVNYELMKVAKRRR